MCPLGVLCCVCGVTDHLAPGHGCACLVRCFACAMSSAPWLLFTAVPARCVVLRVRFPGPLGSCSPVPPLGALLCSCGVLGHLAPVHGCATSVWCVACAVSWAIWLLFTGMSARGVVLCYVCGFPGHLAPVHRCACSILCFGCVVSWATWILLNGVPARCAVLRVRCPGPLGCCSPVCPLGVLCCVCGVLGHLAPVHRYVARGVVLCYVCGVLAHLAPVNRCACSIHCFACTVSWATWLLFTVVPARCVVLCERCPGSLGSCSKVRPRGLLRCKCGVLGQLAPVHRCARSVCCVACAVSWATWLLLPVCVLHPLLFLCGVLGHLNPVHRYACSVRCFARAVSWATLLLFTDVPSWCVVLRVRCPGSLDSCSLVYPLGVLCFLCGVMGHLAPVHRCARSVCCVACAVSWAIWHLFTGMSARGVVFCYVCGVLGHLVPIHQCARSVCSVVCAVS